MLWKLKTKDDREIEGIDSPFSIVKVEDIAEFIIPPIKVILDNGKKLIFFKRHQIDFVQGVGETERRIKYFVGFQQNKEGRNFKCIAEIDNDIIILRDSDGRKD